MKKGGKGGGNTITGLNFEGRADILTLIAGLPGYKVVEAKIGHDILYENKVVANSYKQRTFYKFLESQGVDWRTIISRQLLPDDAIYVIRDNTVYILELKYQEGEGSVDEKLQTSAFKRQQYQKLMAPLNREVEYIYVLNDWFKNPKYKDVLDYVISVDCHYYFEYLPLHKIGLPVPGTT